MSYVGRNLALLLAAIPALGQNTAFYPGRAATITDMTVAVNFCQSTLSAPIGTGDTTLPVLSAACFVVPTLVIVDSEEIRCTGKTSNQLTTCTRNFNSTTAATHLANAAVNNWVLEYFVNQPIAEILALEADMVAGLPVVRGGTGLTSGASGGIPCFTGSATMSSSVAFALNTVLVGGGAGACPKATGVTIDSSGNLSAPGTGTFCAGCLNSYVGLTSPVLFANITTGPPQTNGTFIFCSDCTSPSNPASGAGTGAFCGRQNSAWKCF